MKPGAILTARETKDVLDRLARISADARKARDTRTQNLCRLASLALKAGARRADKYNREQESLLFKLKSIL